MPVISFWVGAEDELHRRLGRVVMTFATADDWVTQILAAMIIHAGEGQDMVETHARLASDRSLRLLDARADEVERRMREQHRGTHREVPADVQDRFHAWRLDMRRAHDRRNRIIHDAWAFTAGPTIMIQLRPPGSEVPEAVDLAVEDEAYEALAARGRDLLWSFRGLVFDAGTDGSR